VDKYPLFYPVDIREDVIDDDELGYVDSQYLNLKIDYSEEDKLPMFEAAKCYVTQTTPKEIQELIELVSQNKENRKFFRRLQVSNAMGAEFWD
jgi:hypothetical protein